MRAYKNGKHVQYRNGRGQFTKTAIECESCPDCKNIILPEYDYSNGFPDKKYPENCPDCGGKYLAT